MQLTTHGKNARLVKSSGTVNSYPNSESWAVVRFDGCLTYQGGSPNDEAQDNHPLSSSGLKFYSLQEVLDSPWVKERAALADKSGSPTRLTVGQRHFVLTLKEDLFECIAKSYVLIGLYDSYDAALIAACQSIRSDAS